MKRMVFSDDAVEESGVPQSEFEPLRVGMPSRIERWRRFATSRNLLNTVLLLITFFVSVQHGFTLFSIVENVAAVLLLINNSQCMYNNG